MIFIGYVFLKNLVWMQELASETWKIGFLVENYIYSLIPRSKLANPDQNTSKLIFLNFSLKYRVL